MQKAICRIVRKWFPVVSGVAAILISAWSCSEAKEANEFSKEANTLSQQANALSQQGNEFSYQQAIAAVEAHNPYLGIITHFDNGNKKHGIFVHNYSSGLAIIESIVISGEENPVLSTSKWFDILKTNGFTVEEISCFAFSMPHKDMGFSGNNGVPLIFVSSDMEKEAENNKFIHRCLDTSLMKKLETIDIQIFYKSRLPDSEIQKAKIWKTFSY